MDRACEWGVYVRLVLPETMDQEAQWNAPCPRWRSKDVFAALLELERLGWIRFLIDDFDEDQVPVVQPAFDHQALIDAYRSRSQALLYRLTDAGGVAWEQTANPSWGLRYVFEVREAASPDEEGECVVTAVTEEIARQAAPQTYAASGRATAPPAARAVAPISLSRMA